MVTLGQKIRIIRTLRGVGQSTLARVLNVDRTLVSHFENNRAIPTQDQIKTIETELGIDFDDPQVETAFATLINKSRSRFRNINK